MSRHNFFRSSQHQRYLAQPFKNPYFKHAPKRRWHRLIIALLILIFLCGVSIFFLRAPAFAIQDIRVTGTESLPSETVTRIVETYLNESAFLFFKHKNRFLFDGGALQQRLMDRYTFETLEITRQGNTLLLRLKERNSQLLWMTGGESYLADAQGIIIRALSSDEQNAHPLAIFIDLNETPVIVGRTILSPLIIESIFRFQRLLQEQHIDFTETRIDRLAGQWVSLRTVVGYDILFDPEGDIDAQANHLAVLLRETVKDPTRLEYIDLRFGDHVYFK